MPRNLGRGGDLPVVGDCDATAKVRTSTFRPSTGEWFLDLSGNGKLVGCSVTLVGRIRPSRRLACGGRMVKSFCHVNTVCINYVLWDD